MTESPRRLAELILARDGAWTDVDAEAVASAYLEAVDALKKGRVFERRYQETLGATWTPTQQEVLDSVQAAFLDAYLAVLRAAS